MSGPSAASIALLAKPTWERALAGAFRSALYLTLGVSLSYGILVGFGQATSNGWAVALLVTIVSIVVGGVISAVLAATWGLLAGYLLGRLLARTSRWYLHLAAYLALGALTGGLVGVLFAVLTTPNIAFCIAISALTGLSVAGGWAMTWRHAIRAERQRHSDELEALLEGDSAVLAE